MVVYLCEGLLVQIVGLLGATDVPAGQTLRVRNLASDIGFGVMVIIDITPGKSTRCVIYI